MARITSFLCTVYFYCALYTKRRERSRVNAIRALKVAGMQRGRACKWVGRGTPMWAPRFLGRIWATTGGRPYRFHDLDRTLSMQ